MNNKAFSLTELMIAAGCTVFLIGIAVFSIGIYLFSRQIPPKLTELPLAPEPEPITTE